jgi:hypothetical protein
MTPVTYATSSAATLTALAAQILTDFPTVVQASAVDIAINKIIITPKS